MAYIDPPPYSDYIQISSFVELCPHLLQITTFFWRHFRETGLPKSGGSIWKLRWEFVNFPSHPTLFFSFRFLSQGFSVALEAVLELALVDQAGLNSEICLLLD